MHMLQYTERSLQAQIAAIGTGATAELAISLVSLFHHSLGVALTDRLALKPECIGRLSIRDLVVTEPHHNLLQLTRKLPTDSHLNHVQLYECLARFYCTMVRGGSQMHINV